MSILDRLISVSLGLGGAITLAHVSGDFMFGAAAFSFYAGLVHALMHSGK